MGCYTSNSRNHKKNEKANFNSFDQKTRESHVKSGKEVVCFNKNKFSGSKISKNNNLTIQNDI